MLHVKQVHVLLTKGRSISHTYTALLLSAWTPRSLHRHSYVIAAHFGVESCRLFICVVCVTTYSRSESDSTPTVSFRTGIYPCLHPCNMPKDAEYEIELDATEATLCAIEEQLEDDSAVMQAEGAHKVNPACRLSSCQGFGAPTD